MGNLRESNLVYTALVRESKHLEPTLVLTAVRLALLSDAATQQFVPLLRVLFHRAGFDASIYEGHFDAVALESLNPGSGLYSFQPDAVAVINSVQALRAKFFQRAGTVTAFVADTLLEIVGAWDAILARDAVTLLQSTYVMPYERMFGNFDRKVEESFSSAVEAINTGIVDAARVRSAVLINDVQHIASWVGRHRWFDDRLWDMAKSFCALDHLPAVARNIVDIVLSARGRIVKCVILDLDNTLWGGVIGDDGIDGIVLNVHGSGESFYRFQCFLKELRKRGILLAVCSKNEMSNALLPFEKHPDMVLRREDITVFQANWDDKTANIRVIQQVLNIGLDSMVFLDDNPFERNLVRGVLPEVIVPELPEDPADYVRAISELNLFETASFSNVDLQRTDLYRAEAERRAEQASFANAGDFLRSLKMRIVVARFDAFHLPRIAQLLQRSNQFNLTTHRYSELECAYLMSSSSVVPLYVKLADRLGDHGLIGVVVVEPEGETLVVRDWLMSCRVLARGVEDYLMNCIVAEASTRGLKTVCGEYIRTAKNQMVKDFYGRFGFTRHSGDGDHALWSLDTSAYESRETFIQPVTEANQAN